MRCDSTERTAAQAAVLSKAGDRIRTGLFVVDSLPERDAFVRRIVERFRTQFYPENKSTLSQVVNPTHAIALATFWSLYCHVADTDVIETLQFVGWMHICVEGTREYAHADRLADIIETGLASHDAIDLEKLAA